MRLGGTAQPMDTDGMTQDPTPPDTEAERKARRSKSLGRIFIILLGLLLAAQMVPFLMRG